MTIIALFRGAFFFFYGAIRDFRGILFDEHCRPIGNEWIRFESFVMNMTEEKKIWILIEKIFRSFLQQTQNDSGRFSREYFQRFSQLLSETLTKYPQYQSSIEQILSSICFPYHSSNLLTLEYQFRLIRYAFRQHLTLINIQTEDLLHHPLLQQSSILRHLALQISCVNDQSSFIELIKLFSSDPNLYVRNTLVEYAAVYLSQHDPCELLEQIREYSADRDLIYQVIIQLNDDQQELLIKQSNLYENLIDTPAGNQFVLKTGKFLDREDSIIIYLNRIFDKSLSDYLHMVLTIMSSRQIVHRSNTKLQSCLHAFFLYMQDLEIEPIEFDDEESSDELTEYICCRLYERNIDGNVLAGIVLDALQPFISHSDSFIYQLEFYRPTIMKMFMRDNLPEKTFAQLIICAEKFSPTIDEHLTEKLIEDLRKKNYSAFVYQALFDYLLHCPNRIIHLEKIHSIIEYLLLKKLDPLYQWDHQDCLLHFLKQICETQQYPSWFNNEFLRQLIEQFVHSTNEYLQGSLIDLFSSLIERQHLSPMDDYLTKNFIQLTDDSLGDVVRCALAHVWLIILIQSNTSNEHYRFSLGSNIDRENLIEIINKQIPLLIGDGGQETEVQCLHLIQSLERINEQLKKVLEFLFNDGASKEIKEHAGRLLGKTMMNEMNDILEEEFQSILHWLEHPDEHMILDCD